MNLKTKFAHIVSAEWEAFFKIKSTDRKWYIPFLAAICVGFPLLIGNLWINTSAGLLGSLAGLVILYLPLQGTFKERIRRMFLYTVGFIISFAVGISFSFNHVVVVFVLFLFTTVVHAISLYYQIKPPRSFFFIMICTMGICWPFEPQYIPQKMMYFSFGAAFAFVLASIHSWLVCRKNSFPEEKTTYSFNAQTQGKEALLIGFLIAFSLAVGLGFHFPNPYWIPISCLAVLQGVDLHHIWRRVIHRILGTFIGLGLCWILVSWNSSTLFLCGIIVVLQFAVEYFIVRNYGLAVLFITPLTFLLAETANPAIYHPTELIAARFNEIAIGSLIGALGGWLIHRKTISKSGFYFKHLK